MRSTILMVLLALACDDGGGGLGVGLARRAVTGPDGGVVILADDPAEVEADESLIEASWADMRRAQFEDEIVAEFGRCELMVIGTISTCATELLRGVGPYTWCTTSVERTLHGVVPSSSLTVGQSGGTIDGVTVTGSHIIYLQPGMRAVMGIRYAGGAYRAHQVIPLGSGNTLGPDRSSLHAFAAQVAARRMP